MVIPPASASASRLKAVLGLAVNLIQTTDIDVSVP